jgi:hypothetical protein
MFQDALTTRTTGQHTYASVLQYKHVTLQAFRRGVGCWQLPGGRNQCPSDENRQAITQPRPLPGSMAIQPLAFNSCRRCSTGTEHGLSTRGHAKSSLVLKQSHDSLSLTQTSSAAAGCCQVFEWHTRTRCPASYPENQVPHGLGPDVQPPLHTEWRLVLQHGQQC